MSRVLRRALCASVAALSAVPSAFADAGGFLGMNRVGENMKGTPDTADVAAQAIVANVMGFLGLIAVFYALWGGFNILTAGGDDGKVKTGKTILIQAGIGLVVIFLAYSIVSFVVNNLLGAK